MSDDELFNSWTMEFPDGRRLDEPTPGRIGMVRVHPPADDERVKFARRFWPERDPVDFDQHSKVWTDRASGATYRLVRGNPMFFADPRREDVALFLIIDDSLVFLRRDGDEQVETQRRDSARWRCSPTTTSGVSTAYARRDPSNRSRNRAR